MNSKMVKMIKECLLLVGGFTAGYIVGSTRSKAKMIDTLKSMERVYAKLKENDKKQEKPQNDDKKQEKPQNDDKKQEKESEINHASYTSYKKAIEEYNGDSLVIEGDEVDIIPPEGYGEPILGTSYDCVSYTYDDSEKTIKNDDNEDIEANDKFMELLAKELSSSDKRAMYFRNSIKQIDYEVILTW